MLITNYIVVVHKVCNAPGDGVTDVSKSVRGGGRRVQWCVTSRSKQNKIITKYEENHKYILNVNSFCHLIIGLYLREMSPKKRLQIASGFTNLIIFCLSSTVSDSDMFFVKLYALQYTLS